MQTIKNKATFSTAILLLISLGISCNFSQKEPQKKDKLQIDYYVRYLHSDKQLKANISFTEIDSTQKKIPRKMEEVLLAGNTLSGKKIGNNYRYQIDKKIPFTNKYQFNYRSSSTATDSTIVQIRPIHDFSVKKGKVSKRAGTNLRITGASIASEETLVILVSDANNKTATIKIDQQPTDTLIKILPEQVNQLATGKGNIYVVRKQSIQTESTEIQLTGLTEYYSAVKAIEIIE